MRYFKDLPKHGIKRMKQAKTKAQGIEKRKMEKTCQRKIYVHNREPIELSYY